MQSLATKTKNVIASGSSPQCQYGRQYILDGTNEKSNKQNKMIYKSIIFTCLHNGAPPFFLSWRKGFHIRPSIL